MAFVFFMLVFFIVQQGVSDKHCLLSLFSFVLHAFSFHLVKELLQGAVFETKEIRTLQAVL